MRMEAVFAFSIVVAACKGGDGAKSDTAAEPTPPPAEAKAPTAPGPTPASAAAASGAEPAPTEQGAAPGQDSAAGSSSSGGAAASSSSSSSSGGEGDAADAPGDGAEGANGEPEVDLAAAAKDAAKDLKRPDDEVFAALDAARTSETKIPARILSRAALLRAKKLHGEPERADRLLRWVVEHDKRNGEAPFLIAKAAALQGDVPTVIEWLTMSKERGGKKYIQQVEFDPMWEIVKDAPEVRALLKG